MLKIKNNPIKAIARWCYDKRFYFLIFFVPVFIMQTVYAAFGVYPYGDNSVLVLDLNGQYVYYFEALRDAFWGDGSFIYSWSRNLSGEMFGIFAYYLASPFTLIPILLPRTMMILAIELMQLAKIGAAALTFCIYLKKTRDMKYYTTLIFSTLYALMGYCVVQLMNPMWIDGLVYLPLIILGLERLVDKGKVTGFIIPLALMFVANFYIGYMIGIFCFIYFIYYVFSREKRVVAAHPWGCIWRFAFSAVVAVLASMIIILPVYNSLKLGKLEFTEPDFTLKTQFLITEFLSKLLPASYDTVRPEGLPFIYCGTITIILAPLYFLNKEISVKKKVSNGALLTVIMLCMYLSTVDIAFHGFQVPNWLPYRYSFVFSFVLLVMAAEAFEKLKGVTYKEIGLSCFAIITFIISLEDKGLEHMQPLGSLWISVGLVLVAYGLVNAYKKYDNILSKVLCMIVIGAELFGVSLQTVYKIDSDVVYSTFSSYQDYVIEGREIVDRIEENDDGLYRSEKTFHRTVNDPMAFGLKGISHSSSTLNAKSIEFLKWMGFTSRGHFTKYNGATKVSDALLGIKYILNKDDQKTIYDYDLEFQDGNISVYKNPTALPIAFLADEKVLDLQLKPEFESDPFNPFEIQNNMLNSLLSDYEAEYFNRIFPDAIDYDNVNKAMAGDHIKYTPIRGDGESENAHIEYTLTATTDDVLYMFLPSRYERKLNVWVNKEFIDYFFEGDNYTVLQLGKFEPGETVSVITTLTQKEAYEQDQYFYYLDDNSFEDAVSILNSKALNITKHSDTLIEGTFTANSEQVMYTSIAYEPGWNIKIDGKSVKPEVIADALLGFKVPEGEHAVTIRFWPDYLTWAIVISVLGLITIVLLVLLEKRGSLNHRVKVRKAKNRAIQYDVNQQSDEE